MAILFVNKNLKIVSYASAYQFKGTREECEEYVELAKQRLTPEQSRQKELEFLRERGGDRLVEPFGGHVETDEVLARRHGGGRIGARELALVHLADGQPLRHDVQPGLARVLQQIRCIHAIQTFKQTHGIA